MIMDSKCFHVTHILASILAWIIQKKMLFGVGGT